MTPDREMTRAVISRLSYKPGWTFKLGGPNSGFLCVFATTTDSQHHDRNRTTQHMFEIPPVADERAFVRWVLDQLLLAEFHECAEFLTFDGFTPFMPHHQDDGSPYELVERWETP